MKWAKQVDKNQKIIVEILRKCGFQVMIVGQPFDLLVCKNSQSWIVEIKDPKKEGWKDEFTPKQKKIFSEWQGAPIIILRTEEEALLFPRKLVKEG